MKVLGITAEYNPFHKGHKYQLEKSKEMTEADYTVAVMSGNFTQRGEAAVFDKWTRSRIAVNEGVDLVVELPFVFACNRAEIFAGGAVDILKGMGVTHISFGSESGDLERLKLLVYDMEKHQERISEVRAGFMKKGDSFVKSFHKAAEQILGKEKTGIMTDPNNILALEYLKRIRYWNEKGSALEAVTVKRYGSGYNDVDSDKGYAGASVIRQLAAQRKIGEAADYVTEHTAEAFAEGKALTEWEHEAFKLIRGEIVRCEDKELEKVYCMGEGLENKLKKEIIHAESFKELISSVVSRRYTEAAVRRLLIYVLMGMKMREPNFDLYARVLAVGPKGRELLKKMKKEGTASIPVITNINKDVQDGDLIWDTLKFDCRAADMYNLINGRDLYDFSDRVIKPYIKND